MTKQEFARKRNFAKYRLLGITTHEISEVGTGLERTLAKQVNDLLTKLKDNWDDNSKELGLNVKERCWCGKIATTTSKCIANLGDPVCVRHEHKVE